MSVEKFYKRRQLIRMLFLTGSPPKRGRLSRLPADRSGQVGEHLLIYRLAVGDKV
jgi:hypothetical protein